MACEIREKRARAEETAVNKRSLQSLQHYTDRMLLAKVLSFLVLIEAVSCSTGDLQCQEKTWREYPSINGTSTAQCQCSTSLSGVVHCDPTSDKTSILPSYCMTYDDTANETKTVVGYCNLYSGNFTTVGGYVDVPIDLTEVNEFMCAGFNREGRLCGKCKEGFAVGLFSYDLRCVDCSESNSEVKKWSVFFVMIFALITVFFFIEIIFRLNITSGYLNAFIFFSQMFSLQQSKDFHLLAEVCTCNRWFANFSDVTTTLYAFWQLDFFRIPASNVCFSRSLTALDVVAIEYTTAGYLVILAVVAYILIELHGRGCKLLVLLWKPFRKPYGYIQLQINSAKNTPIDIFGTFLVLLYTKLTITSLKLLNWTVAYNSNGGYSRYLSIDRTVGLFSKEHTGFAILAIVILFTVTTLPVVLLILYQFSFFQRCFQHVFQVRIQNAIKTFAELFNGCYENGTEGTCDFRYFSALYFVLRVVLIISSFENSFSLHLGKQLVILTLFCSALAFALLKPYRVKWFNYLDAAIMSVLGAIYLFTLSGFYNILIGDLLQKVTLVIIALLSLVPLVYATALFSFWLLPMKNKWLPKLKQALANTVVCGQICESRPDEISLSLEFAHRVVNPQDYERV